MRISDARFAIVDTETSGLDPADSELLEIGAVLSDWRGKIIDRFETLVKPTKPLTADNSAIHGLIDEDFAKAKTIDSASYQFLWWLPDDTIIVTHHLEFDRGFLPWIADRQGLCSKRLASHLCPDSPSSKNQVLRYWFKDVARDPHIRALGDTHRAIADATVTATILPHLIDIYLAQGGEDDIDALIAFAESPYLIKHMWLGKHYGKPIAEIDKSYLVWALQTIDLDRDQRFTLEHYTLGEPVDAEWFEPWIEAVQANA